MGETIFETSTGEIASGLTDRLRTLLLSLDRRDRLESAGVFAGWLGDERDQGRLPDDAREMLLRAFRVAADPVNYRILEALDPLEAIELADLLEQIGLSRVAASERVHDLVQTGLAVRELVGDQIRGTALSHGLVAWVTEIAEKSGSQIAAELPASNPARDAADRA